LSGPAAVIVAGAATIWLAFSGADGLVAEDYYKQGLAINRRLAREDEARRRGISASVALHDGLIEVDLKGEKPPVLFVHLAHATRAGHDVRLRLTRTPSGRYEARLDALAPGHWRFVIEDERGSWRVAQERS
jgi:hypothetical protein